MTFKEINPLLQSEVYYTIPREINAFQKRATEAAFTFICVTKIPHHTDRARDVIQNQKFTDKFPV